MAAQRKGETREEFLARRKESDRQYRDANRDTINARHREYRAANREDVNARQKARRDAKREEYNAEFRARERKRMENPEYKAKEMARRNAHHIKRRRMKADTAVEPIVNERVFDRDGWVCGICAEPVHPDEKWPHPRSASLDHIVPLSLGGAHVYENVRLTCLRCNVARGNRIEESA